MRSARVSPALVSVLVVATAGFAAPGMTAVQPGVTGAFIDGWPGAAHPYAPVNLVPPATLIQYGNAWQVVLESLGPPVMSYVFQSSDGSPLTVGSYASDEGDFSQISPIDCSMTQDNTFEIVEIERDKDGLLTRFAVDFTASCPNWQPPLPESATGSVRFNSTIGYRAFSITPLRVFPWDPDATLPDQPVGTTDDTTAFVVTNRGSLPLVTGESDPAPSDDLLIGDGTCDGTALPPGATCTVVVTFSPSMPGPQDFQLTLLTPELSRSQRTLALRALATTTTQTTVSVDPLFVSDDPYNGDPSPTSYTVNVVPPGAVGSVELSSSCGVGLQGSNLPQGATTFFAQTPPGPCDVWASFTGNLGSGYGPSTSQVVSFIQPVRSSIYVSRISGGWVVGNTVRLEVGAGPGNGDPPSDGQLTLQDDDTQAVLATEPVTAVDRTMLVDVITMSPGIRRLRAIYDGSANMVGSSYVYTYVVEADGSPPEVSIRPSDGAGWTIEPEITLDVTAHDLGNEVTDLRLSNDALHWKLMPYTTSVLWSLVDPAYGGTVSDGPRTISAQVKDAAGNWSSSGTWPITLDRGAPAGSVTVDGGDPYVNRLSVSVDVPAIDAVSPVANVALSNDGMNWTTRPYGPDQAWTLAASDGTRTVFCKWQDKAGNWSSVKNDTVVLDRSAPAGVVSVAAGAAYARSTAVTLSVAATDPGSGVSQVALSNDGTTWTTRAYAPSQAWTLPTANGTRTVHAKWRDAAGNWSAVKTDTIILDTVAPTSAAPTRSLLAGTAISAGRISSRLAWSGSDATSGVARYELQQSTDAGAWATVSTTLPRATLDRLLATGHRYAFRVRAVDKAGNIGMWTAGPTARLSHYSEKSSSITFSSSWRQTYSTVFWGGGAKKSSTAGAKAKFTFTGRSIAFVSRLGPTKGRARIYVDGKLVGTIDLYSSTYKSQRVVWTRNWTTSGKHTVSIVVNGTATRPRVDVDAFVLGG